MASKKNSIEAVNYVEESNGHRASAARRGSVDVPIHTGKPVWEQRETYGPSGLRGIFQSKYVFAAAAFATLGGTLFGYEYV